MVDDTGKKIAEQAKADREAWQKRVLNEVEDVKGKVANLHTFVNGTAFETVADEEKPLLKAQLRHMEAYLQTLKSRAALHKST